MPTNFVPDYPLSVVGFTGYPMSPASERAVTDWHVIDQRGRTVRIFPAYSGFGQAIRRRYAERYARTGRAPGVHRAP